MGYLPIIDYGRLGVGFSQKFLGCSPRLMGGPLRRVWAHAWLLSLRRRLAEVEEDTPEVFGERKQLVRLLVESSSLGKRQGDERVEVQITYRFGPPPASEAVPLEDSSIAPLRNGSRS